MTRSKPWEQYDYHPTSEMIVNILRRQTQNTRSNLYFRVLASYFMAQMASSMRTYVKTSTLGSIPVNTYVCALMESGAGKGHSMNIMEDSIVNGFKDVFTQSTFPLKATEHIEHEAARKAHMNQSDYTDELEKLYKEFNLYGAMPYSFSEGTAPAYKQIRTKAQMAGIGSLNYICYTGDVEVLTDTGFKRLDSLKGSERVAQMSMDNKREVTFVNPSRFIENDYEGTLYHFVSPTGVDMSVTHDHMNVVQSQGGYLTKVAAQDTKAGYGIVNTVFAPNIGESQITLMDRLLIAIQADGTIRKHGIELTFKKEVKITRLRAHLDALKINYTEALEKRGYIRFYISFSEFDKEYDFKNLPSLFPNLLTRCNLITAREFISELVMWDGNIRQNNLRYTNKYLHNVEFAQTIAVMAGLKTKIIHNPKKGYTGGYYVNMLRHHNGFHTLRKESITTSNYKGKTYCVTVPSGAIVLRRNGKTFVGGNCDEIGSNLLAAQELFTVCLETYDVGKVKDKITKSSSDNIRQESRSDPVPSNMLVFGTPAKVFNGGKEENEFISLQETGYARRFLFGFGNKGTEHKYTAEELYDLLASNATSGDMQKLSTRFARLADAVNFGKVISVNRDQGIQLLQYKMDCEAFAETFPEHDHIRKAEMQHRYFKALKLAGAYAFCDETTSVTEDQLYAAIKVVEDSGNDAFKQILNRPKPYERLARYLGSMDTEVTHADLTEELPFYRGNQSAKNDMLQLASAWGYKENIIIKRFFKGGIEFLKGESLQETSLDEIIISYSTHEAFHYRNEKCKFKDLHKLTQKQGMHWTNHHMLDGHRQEINAIQGFNTVVIDCDGGVSINTAKLLLQEYTCMFYTTKRHTAENHRFRIVIPLKYHLRLEAKDFKEFMQGIFDWLPFKVDTETGQRCRKWLSFNGSYGYNDGTLLDPLQFIPKTSKNEERKKEVQALGSLDSTERWFASKMAHGNRNNNMIKYALMLKDAGMAYEDVEATVLAFNGKLSDGLSDAEMHSTILKSVASKYV